jgi:hypothetical protein
MEKSKTSSYRMTKFRKILVKFEHKFDSCGLLALDIVKENGGVIDLVVSCSDGTFRALTLADNSGAITLQETETHLIDNSVCLNHFVCLCF